MRVSVGQPGRGCLRLVVWDVVVVGHAGVVHLSEVPMPAAVAARPRDGRGVPVPAITPWERGVPLFTEASGERQLLCALQNRCSICAAPFDDGEGVWHVVDDQAAKWISYALRRGKDESRQVIWPHRGHRIRLHVGQVVDSGSVLSRCVHLRFLGAVEPVCPAVR